MTVDRRARSHKNDNNESNYNDDNNDLKLFLSHHRQLKTTLRYLLI
jgi:hypothetical protein